VSSRLVDEKVAPMSRPTDEARRRIIRRRMRVLDLQPEMTKKRANRPPHIDKARDRARRPTMGAFGRYEHECQILVGRSVHETETVCVDKTTLLRVTAHCSFIDSLRLPRIRAPVHVQ